MRRRGFPARRAGNFNSRAKLAGEKRSIAEPIAQPSRHRISVFVDRRVGEVAGRERPAKLLLEAADAKDVRPE
jgi:hypothetical protein